MKFNEIKKFILNLINENPKGYSILLKNKFPEYIKFLLIHYGLSNNKDNKKLIIGCLKNGVNTKEELQKRIICKNKNCNNKLKVKRNWMAEYCSLNCANSDPEKIKKTEKTWKKKRGFSNPSKSKKIRDKTKKTCKKKYGTEYVLSNKEIQKKKEETNLKKYGTKCTLQNKIIKEKIKQTNIKRYGVENPWLSKEILRKRKKTMIDKYGVEHPTHSKKIQEKKNNTNQKKYGYNHHWKNNKIRKKSQETWEKKYGKGVVNPMQAEEIQKKKKNTLIKKYGTDHNMKVESIREKQKISRKINLLKKQKLLLGNNYKYINKDKGFYYLKHKNCGNVFRISISHFYKKIKDLNNLCIYCNNYNKTYYSKMEKDLLNFIQSFYENDILENKKILKTGRKHLEIDIYLPKLKLGIEFNGIYWHSLNKKPINYHQKKFILAKNQGIELIQVWEDDWIYNKEIVKYIIFKKISNRILNNNKIIFKKNNINNINRIKEIKGNNIYQIKDFLINNYLFNLNNIKNNLTKYKTKGIILGLFNNNEIISLMCCLKNNSNNTLIIDKFCNKVGENIDKDNFSFLWNYLLTNFINKLKNKNIKKVIMNINISYFFGNRIKKLGFKQGKLHNPKKYLIGKENGYIREEKDLLLNLLCLDENKLKNKGYYEIEDAGEIEYYFNL